MDIYLKNYESLQTTISYPEYNQESSSNCQSLPIMKGELRLSKEKFNEIRGKMRIRNNQQIVGIWNANKQCYGILHPSYAAKQKLIDQQQIYQGQWNV